MHGNGLPAEELSEVLDELARGLKDLYGERCRGLVLCYGSSYARGEADEDGDVDVLLLLKGPVATGRETTRTGDATWLISLEVGYTLSVLPVDVEDFPEPQEPSCTNALREGVPVAWATLVLSLTEPRGLSPHLRGCSTTGM